MLIERYQGKRLSIVSSIIKQFLYFQCLSPAAIQADSFLISLLNSNLDSSWVIFMIRCGIISNPQEILLQSIKAITYEITSQYELECKMALPFYMCLFHSQEFVQILSH